MTYYINLQGYVLAILYLIILLISFFIYRRKKRKIKFLPIAFIILYVLLLIQVTIFPIWILSTEELDEFHQSYGDYIKYYQFIPFYTIKSTLTSLSAFIRQDLGNILLLLPIPIFIGLIKKRFSIKKAVAFGVLVSITIELFQLLINLITKYPSHLCDIDDVILNLIGIVLGIFIFLIIKRIKPLYRFIISFCRNK